MYLLNTVSGSGTYNVRIIFICQHNNDDNPFWHRAKVKNLRRNNENENNEYEQY